MNINYDLELAVVKAEELRDQLRKVLQYPGVPDWARTRFSTLIVEADGAVAMCNEHRGEFIDAQAKGSEMKEDGK